MLRPPLNCASLHPYLMTTPVLHGSSPDYQIKSFLMPFSQMALLPLQAFKAVLPNASGGTDQILPDLIVVLEEEMATHSTTLAWKIPWVEKPGRLATVHGVAESRTRLSDFTFVFTSLLSKARGPKHS